MGPSSEFSESKQYEKNNPSKSKGQTHMLGKGKSPINSSVHSIPELNCKEEVRKAQLKLLSKNKTRRPIAPVVKNTLSNSAENDWTMALCEVTNFKVLCLSLTCPCLAMAEARRAMDGSSTSINICLAPCILRWLMRSAYVFGNTDSCVEDLFYTSMFPCCTANQMLQTALKQQDPRWKNISNRKSILLEYIDDSASSTEKSSKTGMKESDYYFIKNNVRSPIGLVQQNDDYSVRYSSSEWIATFFCMPCVVGEILERAMGMPYYLGCCCVGPMTAHHLVRYQYRIPQRNDGLFMNDATQDCGLPLLLCFCGVGFSACCGLCLLHLWRVRILLEANTWVQRRQSVSAPGYLVGFSGFSGFSSYIHGEGYERYAAFVDTEFDERNPSSHRENNPMYTHGSKTSRNAFYGRSSASAQCTGSSSSGGAQFTGSSSSGGAQFTGSSSSGGAQFTGCSDGGYYRLGDTGAVQFMYPDQFTQSSNYREEKEEKEQGAGELLAEDFNCHDPSNSGYINVYPEIYSPPAVAADIIPRNLPYGTVFFQDDDGDPGSALSHRCSGEVVDDGDTGTKGSGSGMMLCDVEIPVLQTIDSATSQIISWVRSLL